MVIGNPTVLNLVPSGIPPVIHLNQTDAGFEKRFLIKNGDEPFNVPEGVSATIRGKKGDSNGIAAAATVTAGSNVVDVTITQQMTAVAGSNNIFELVFVNSSGLRVGTINMIFKVEADAQGSAVISDSEIEYAEQVLTELQSVAAVNAQVQQNAANIANEITRATAAETAEASARAAADTTLQSNINSEASTRATQDASLQSQIDQLVAPSGSAPSAAEVENARVGADGTVYDTLGNAIRGQVTDLKSQIKYGVNTFNKGIDLALKNGYTISTVNSDGFTQGFWDANNSIHVSSNRICSTGYVDSSIVAMIVPSGWYGRLGIYNISTGNFSLQPWGNAITNSIFYFDHSAYKYNITVCKTDLDADVVINDCYNIALVKEKIELSNLSYDDANLLENSFIVKNPSWAIGEINGSTGASASSTKGLRTGYITFSGNGLIVCDDGYMFVLFEYDGTTYTGVRTGNSNRYYLPNSSKRYRIVLKRSFSDSYYDAFTDTTDSSHIHIYDYAITEPEYNDVFRIGDSLTAQQSASELAGYIMREVKNYGIGGETSVAIGCRAGAIPFYINNITIPADETAVQISATTDFGDLTFANPTDAKAGINPCWIKGVKGAISKSGDNLYFTPEGTRTMAVPITRPTAVITSLSKKKCGTLVLWAGANDGTSLSSADEIIRNLDFIIKSVNPDKYIVLSWLVCTPQSDIYDCNAKLLEHYGKHFLNVHKYCQDYGLADAGLTPQHEDEVFMNAGYIPYFLLNDTVTTPPETVHPNAAGRTVIMKCIARKMMELGYIALANA